jgi:3D (Asp-Asp-Asp) domain-containing protein
MIMHINTDKTGTALSILTVIFFMIMGVVKTTDIAVDVIHKWASTDEAAPEVEVGRDAFTEMNVSAYCPCEKCCGEWADGFFADGSPVGGKAIAADTSIYPMGTVFDVPGYGVAVVKDRGGAIKGNKLDLYFNTHQDALNWGRQFITVERIAR